MDIAREMDDARRDELRGVQSDIARHFCVRSSAEYAAKHACVC